MGALAAAKGMGIASLTTVAFAGRYFRELSDRASVIERMEALSKVERVRALVRSRTSEGVTGAGRVQSPAERLLEMLGQVMLTCRLVKDEDYGVEISSKFDDTTQILQKSDSKSHTHTHTNTQIHIHTFTHRQYAFSLRAQVCCVGDPTYH